ncbi:hypothetical protein D3C71_2044340 [compost metagenome]
MQGKLRQMFTKLLQLIHKHGDHIGEYDRKACQKYGINQQNGSRTGNFSFSEKLNDRIQHI